MIERLISVYVDGRTYKYRVTFEPDEDGRIVADCPALAGCFSEGRSHLEAIEMIKDAMTLTIESMIELGEEIPSVKYGKRAVRLAEMRIGSRRHTIDRVV
jgi:predicted RNase H-like HicB family nuclease